MDYSIFIHYYILLFVVFIYFVGLNCRKGV